MPRHARRETRLGRLGRVRLDEERVGVRQRHREVVQLALGAADHAERLTEIHLRVARPMRQWHEDLARPALLLPDMVGDDCQLASEAVLVAKALEDPLRRVPLLLQHTPVVFQDLLDDADERIELRPRRRAITSVSRWHGVPQDLRHRLAIDPEMKRCSSRAHSVNVARTAHTAVKFHRIHLPAFSSLPQA